MKKTFSVILSLLVLAAAFLPSLYALAIVPGETEEIPLLQEGDFDLPTASESHYASLANTTQTAVEQAIYEGMLKAESQIYIGSYGIPTDDAGALLAKVVNNNPDLFFVSSSYSYNYYPSTGKVAYLFPFYAMTADEIEAAQAVFNQGVADALSCVDSSMSDVQKALTLHDYICDLGIIRF
ncbi:MAG: hypothetical protein IJ168_05440 [Eubacterium sp.]|nr:hypothetical protein [Eubacterium sp.]